MSGQKKTRRNLGNFLDTETELDDAIVDRKFDNYIEQIKEKAFYAGNIEIAISCLLFNLNISVYKLINENNDIYTHFDFWKDINDINNDFLVILFSNNNHYSLLNSSNYKNNNKIKDFKSISEKIINFNSKNLDIDIENLKDNKLCFLKNDKNYYDNIYNYIVSFELNTKMEKLIGKGLYTLKIYAILMI